MQLSKRLRLLICPLLIAPILISSGCSKKSEDTKEVTKKDASVEIPVVQRKFAALVNGTEISNEELDRELKRIQQRFYSSATMSSEQQASVKKEILEILINNELLFQASQKLTIDPTQEEIDTDLKKAQVMYPTTEKFTNTFTADDIKKKLSIEKYISQAFSDTTVITDEMAKEYYQSHIEDFTRPEQVFVSHILIAAPGSAPEEQQQKALEKITDIQSQLQSGTSFKELADKYSDDPKKMEGGQIGYVVHGQYDAEFENAAFSLALNEYSNIIKTKYGYHILTVSDKKDEYVFPFEEIAEKLKSYLKQKEVQKKIDNFITSQRATTNITRYL